VPLQARGFGCTGWGAGLQGACCPHAPPAELPECHWGREGGSAPLGNPGAAAGADTVNREGRKKEDEKHMQY